jgi:hypothetical protein
MNLNFNKVGYDGELEDFSEDELRDLVREFESAQDSNVAEFETAVEATEGIDESEISEFEEARQDLIDEIAGAEKFEDVPLSEDKLQAEDFSELQNWHDFVSDLEAEEAETEESEGDFGQRSPVQGGEGDTDFADEALGGMQGLNL